MRIGAAGGGGAVLLCASSSATSSAALAPVNASLRGSSFSKDSSSCLGCNHNLRQTGLLLSLKRRKRGKRFEAVRASNEDEGDKNRDAEFNNPDKDSSVDWDKAWSSFSKPQKKRPFLKLLDMEQYVSRRPKHSNYPLSEEVDPLRRSERSALGAWTSMNFTFALVVVIVGLAVYMVIIVGPPPHH